MQKRIFEEEKIARNIQDNIENFEEDNFDGTEEKYEEKKYLESNRWIGRSHSTNYLFIYLFIGNKLQSTIYEFIQKDFT